MNKELIQKLFSKSCWDEQAEVDIEDFISVEKFAELIVRECISELEISKKVDPYTGVLFDCEYNKCIDEQSTMLKEHFGVEE